MKRLKPFYPAPLPMYCDLCKEVIMTDGKYIWCKCHKEKAHFLKEKR